MSAAAMEPFGNALLAFERGDAAAVITVRRDDGREYALPASHFFRDESEFSEIEKTAVSRCHGRVLDIGAGAGSLSLALQRRGCSVMALDISGAAAEVAKRRGVADVVCADVRSFDGGPFDTLLMMGHGIGMVETIDGLRDFLRHARSLLAPGGRLLLDSLDVSATDDPANLAYHDANREAGRYIGEIRMQFEFDGRQGPACGWLQVDASTLQEHADGWVCEVVVQGEHGDYLAELRRAAI